ncbi:HAD-IC family P-type ATPase [Lachnoclostridium phytofermentans]|uniref:ATPase, P-type (Transporting), HAD superfamily, subfamily IC n=1 Tax=Lachnoclostridium phytofermentans (strain ATCC 700394 / DSM 18823 / ISDg) TaxID=357809 RepID=A9KQM7_LACP7|nr:HAD-IC family P-type ATPase [Lachnoclostridium phytofermentans]ABX41940.1 ATPase, P-type (transporting), HAD superfamily, subfamily IC [Lachnoclostridium phytofermentans ISDg]
MPEYPKTIKKFRLKHKHYDDIQRFNPDPKVGLSKAQVRERISQGRTNINAAPSTKSIWLILRDSTFSLFNLIILFLAGALIYIGEYKHILFAGIMLTNVGIDLFQELRAKRATDKLSILTSATAQVLRSGKKEVIPGDQVVLDDILYYNPGKQIVTDSQILKGGCEVNEAMLTGESEPVYKETGDMLYSGSFISSGNCIAIAEAVGRDNAVYEITAGAKKVKTRKSEIVKGLQKIIKFISVVIIPFGLLFFNSQISNLDNNVVEATKRTVAAMIGMIPSGLILLTSTVFAVIVVKLARKRVLVNELYSIEMLARADVICLDKTGTLTEGSMTLEDILYFIPDDKSKILSALASLGMAMDANETMSAINIYCIGSEITPSSRTVPFSSKKKWCGAYFEGTGAYVLGAPERIITERQPELRAKAKELAKRYRVLCLAVNSSLSEELNDMPDRTAVCLLLLSDTIRKNAKETISYLKEQGVSVRIISGDNPATVSHIAQAVGVENFEKAIDLSELTDDNEIKNICEDYVVFGRTTPVQKQLLIQAMRDRGHVVAMTGDGVNDVLAMKESDCAIAVAKGTDAARTVADMVLLDSSFKAIPAIIEEGRSSINNIQRTASLFLTKTIYSTLLLLAFLFSPAPYPFSPIQLSLISPITIGIPSFLLAFRPDKKRVSGRFIRNVLYKALPGGVTIFFAVMFVQYLSGYFLLSDLQISTISVILTGGCALFGLLFISFPLDRFRFWLVVSLSVLFTFAVLRFRRMFDFNTLAGTGITVLLLGAAFSVLVFWLVKLAADFFFKETDI